jgi:hypothetical protein
MQIVRRTAKEMLRLPAEKQGQQGVIFAKSRNGERNKREESR